MEKYQWIVILVLIGYTVLFSGCDEMEQMMEPVMTDREISVELADVLIYTGNTWWITPTNAKNEAQITQNLLQFEGIQAEITEDEAEVREWMLQTTSDGFVNVLILYGLMPTTIYPPGNSMPDGSVAEKWIESFDGNTILNHASSLGFWSTGNTNFGGQVGQQNGDGTLQNLMDIPNIRIDTRRNNIPMTVTEDGNALTPSLVGFQSDRPFPLFQLEAEWFAERIFASNTGDSLATLADPVIVRDGYRGRLAIVHQTNSEDNPKGNVAAQIIHYLLQDTNVIFPDTNLANKVREALDLPTRALIPKSKLSTLTVLEAWVPEGTPRKKQINDLTGLEYATELSELLLLNNRISDITPLTGLTRLTVLDLWNNEVSDITPLTQLTQLAQLNLGENQISDITTLAELTQLTHLLLNSNQISDATALTELVNLKALYLTGNPILDKAPLQRLLKKNPNMRVDIVE